MVLIDVVVVHFAALVVVLVVVVVVVIHLAALFAVPAHLLAGVFVVTAVPAVKVYLPFHFQYVDLILLKTAKNYFLIDLAVEKAPYQFVA